MSCQATPVLLDCECHCQLSKKLCTEGNHLSFPATFALFSEGPFVVSHQAPLDLCSQLGPAGLFYVTREGGSCQHQAGSSVEALPPRMAGRYLPLCLQTKCSLLRFSMKTLLSLFKQGLPRPVMANL